MHYRDLRGWLDGVESFGELRIVEGAHWNQEIGAVAEVAAHIDPVSASDTPHHAAEVTEAVDRDDESSVAREGWAARVYQILLRL